ncbi:acetylcholine receptor subunit delta isoform X2 [Petromyzon marinus]|uniref:acetylcholine receptor subunit delta isoform X2 n=1 Tax=Petromyzon marinus TaxID=7757 RepID=UPI003F6FA2D3
MNRNRYSCDGDESNIESATQRAGESLVQNEEQRLYNDLFKNYNRDVRPTHDKDVPVDISLGLSLSNLISLKEADETLLTNVWIDQTWTDYRLSWDPEEYGGIVELRVPSTKVWLPEIVLENNIDGQYTMALYCNVILDSSGLVYWLPPAIYRSYCSISVINYPFDWQNCTLVFRSLTYSAREINMQLKLEQDQDPPNKFFTVEWIVTDKEAFTENGEWEIVHLPAKKHINTALSKDDTKYQNITFYVIIQRKPLFYVINIIIPMVIISLIASLAYYLPCDCGEKMTVSISVLLAQTVFLFLVAQKLPETSLEVPIIAKYLMFIMVLVTMVVLSSVVVLNLHHRSPSTHHLQPWMRKVFLERLPRILHMSQPEDSPDSGAPGLGPRRRSSLGLIATAEEYVHVKARSELMFERMSERHGLVTRRTPAVRHAVADGVEQQQAELLLQLLRPAVQGALVIAQHTRDKNLHGEEKEAWNRVARTLDRLCLFVVGPVMVLGTITIFLSSILNRSPNVPFEGETFNYTPAQRRYI